MAASKKFRDARRHPGATPTSRSSSTISPPRTRGRLASPRFVEVRGRAEVHTDGGAAVGVRIGAGMPFDPARVRIGPRRIVAMDI
jgi:pyridoxamine 5'-phosphate oxidase family protein